MLRVGLSMVIAAIAVAVAYRQIEREQPSPRADVSIRFTDRAGDGTPDFLRLDTISDRENFINSFTSIAEYQYYRRQQEIPAEVTDCSAFVRFAYRMSFAPRNSDWSRSTGIQGDLVFAGPERYQYPKTPVGPRLFRTKPGPFTKEDLKDRAAFSEFADADHLRRYNTHFISRDIERAIRGDLLFYRQADQQSPAHMMIFLGNSHIDQDGEPRVVYHTGPSGKHPGEIRRPAIRDLLHHPEPRWRPVSGNSNFFGIYRWNILRGDS